MSLWPKRPMFSVPEEPAAEATMILEAAKAPPSAKVRVFPVPRRPTMNSPLLVQRDPAPLISTVLLEEPMVAPM